MKNMNVVVMEDLVSIVTKKQAREILFRINTIIKKTKPLLKILLLMIHIDHEQ